MRLCVYPLGVRSTRFIGPACAEPPGGTRRWNVEAPRRAAEALFRSNLASRSPHGERSARAFRIAIPWHDPATCGAAAMPRNHYAMADPRERFHTPSGFVISPSADPRTGAFAPAGCRVCPFHSEPRVTWLPRRHPLPEERRVVSDRICLLASPASTTLLHAQPSRSPLRPRPGTKRAR